MTSHTNLTAASTNSFVMNSVQDRRTSGDASGRAGYVPIDWSVRIAAAAAVLLISTMLLGSVAWGLTHLDGTVDGVSLAVSG